MPEKVTTIWAVLLISAISQKWVLPIKMLGTFDLWHYDVFQRLAYSIILVNSSDLIEYTSELWIYLDSRPQCLEGSIIIFINHSAVGSMMAMFAAASMIIVWGIALHGLFKVVYL